MENKKTLTEEIIDAVRGEFQSFKKTMITDVRDEVGLISDEVGSIRGEVGLIRGEMASIKSEVGSIKGDLGLFKNEVNERFDEMGKRFDKVDIEIRNLGVGMEELDGKFSLITEGQDMIREVLETRVVNIEEILGVENRI